MVLTNIENFEKYGCLNDNFTTLYKYLKEHDLLSMELGKIEVDGDKLFINNIKVDGVPADVQPLEMHRKYIDVHILLEGSETIGIKPLGRMSSFSKEYSDDGDCALSQEAADCYVDLKPGDMMICFPEDGHAPAIGCGAIRKAIAKVIV